MSRPTFFRPKSERSGCPCYDPLARYRVIARGIYEWTGLPDDVPEGYIEEALFEYGCIGAKNVEGLGVCITPAAPVSTGIYGNPLTWLPTGIQATSALPGLMTPSDAPVLWIGEAPADRAEMFADIAHNALVSLRQNVIALRQPIALDGEPGRTADGIVLKSELENGEQYIPVIDGKRLGVQVLDLKAKDYTAQLVAVYNAMDNEILTIIGVKNTGTEKASGITTEETTALHQELSVVSDIGLKLRRQWCAKINAKLGTSFAVELSDGYALEEVPDTEEKPTGEAVEDVPEVIPDG